MHGQVVGSKPESASARRIAGEKPFAKSPLAAY